jgi:plasmid stabilization system protein ParE
MKLPVIWSHQATNEYLQIIDHLILEWGDFTAKKYVARIEYLIGLITENPQLFVVTPQRKDVRRCVVNKQTSLYYRVYKNRIEIISLFRTRKNP